MFGLPAMQTPERIAKLMQLSFISVKNNAHIDGFVLRNMVQTERVQTI